MHLGKIIFWLFAFIPSVVTESMDGVCVCVCVRNRGHPDGSWTVDVTATACGLKLSHCLFLCISGLVLTGLHKTS